MARARPSARLIFRCGLLGPLAIAPVACIAAHQPNSPADKPRDARTGTLRYTGFAVLSSFAATLASRALLDGCYRPTTCRTLKYSVQFFRGSSLVDCL
jgi:hypothetical protein